MLLTLAVDVVVLAPRLDRHVYLIAVRSRTDLQHQVHRIRRRDGRRDVIGRYELTVACKHLAFDAVNRLRRHLVLVPARRIHPSHRVRIERHDVLVCVIDDESETDARVAIILERGVVVRCDDIFDFIGDVIEGPDDVVVCGTVVAWLVVAVERFATSRLVCYFETTYVCRIRIERLADTYAVI